MELAASLLRLLQAQITAALGSSASSQSNKKMTKKTKAAASLKNDEESQNDSTTKNNSTKKKKKMKCPLTAEGMEGMFALSLCWSIGGAVDGNSRLKLDNYMRRLLTGRVIGDDDHSSFLETKPMYNNKYEYPGKLSIELPASNIKRKKTKENNDGDLLVTLFEYSFKPKSNKGMGAWQLWSNHSNITKYVVPDGVAFSSIIVPTVDTVRNEWLMEILVEKSNMVSFQMFKVEI